MLVLSRKLNEKIQIGDNITVSVTQVRGNVVRLGIEAPRSVRVLRSEVQAALAKSEDAVVEKKDAVVEKKRYFSCLG